MGLEEYIQLVESNLEILEALQNTFTKKSQKDVMLLGGENEQKLELRMKYCNAIHDHHLEVKGALRSIRKPFPAMDVNSKRIENCVTSTSLEHSCIETRPVPYFWPRNK